LCLGGIIILAFLLLIFTFFLMGSSIVITYRTSKLVCFIPWYQATILTNGDVIACPYNSEVLGNIKKNNFRAIWFSSEYNNFRQTLDCGTCSGNAVYPYLRRFKNLWKIKI
ncbi:MAG: SPASM domain-containing protein, partial [Candidatus Omnitrophota bacterium]